MSENAPLPTPAAIQERLLRGPYHQWLGLEVTAVAAGEIELTARWREEWVVNPDKRYTHGGILAALVDLAADWALVRSEEHTSELQSLMRISYAVFCLKKKILSIEQQLYLYIRINNAIT